MLHVQGFAPFGFIAYPVIPWIGVMALGYSLGNFYDRDADERRTLLISLGWLMLIAFFVLRLVNGYGDPTPWEVQPTFVQTLFSFFNVQKYPPSLLYVLVTLGLAFPLLAVCERMKGPGTEVLRTFGRVPLFFYVLHIVLAHLAAGITGLIDGYGFEIFTAPLMQPTAGWGFSLAAVYLVWCGVMVIAYPLCRWFADLKQRRNDWWLAYL